MQRTVTVAVLLLATYLTVANIFIVNVGAPSIQIGLEASFSDVQLIVSSYTLAFAIALSVGGRLGDRFGRKRMLQLGIVLFSLASLLCGLTSSVVLLVVARIIQGLSAAMISPQVLSLIQVLYPSDKRGPILGAYGATQGIAATTGQIIGGLLLQANPWGLEWRTVFLFSVPIGLLILGATFYITESKTSEKSTFDWGGISLAVVGLSMLMFPLVQGQREGWPPVLIVSLIVSAPMLMAFVWYEKRILRQHRIPFIQVNLFQVREFSVGMLMVFLLMSSQAAFFLIAAYLLQLGLGLSALETGLIILPMGIGYFSASLMSTRVARKMGVHVLTLGSVLTAVGYVVLAVSFMMTGTEKGVIEWTPGLVLTGAGQGLLAATLNRIVLSKIQKSDVGSASGVLMTGFQVAYAIGICLIGIVWLNGLQFYADGGQAGAQSYVDTFILCIELLAVCTALLIPLSIVLAGKSRKQEAPIDAKLSVKISSQD